MQAARLLSLVKNVTDLRPEELGEARELLKRYPYSQALQLIVARGSRDQKGPDQQATLNRAAVYATDRAVLKSVMTRVVQPRVESLPVGESSTPPPAPKKSPSPVKKAEAPTAKVAPVAPAPDPAIIKPKETPVRAKEKPQQATPAAPATPPTAPATVEEKKTAPPTQEKPPQTTLAAPPTPAPATVEAKKAAAPAKEKPPVPVAPSSKITLEGDALREDLKTELNRLQQLKSQFAASYEQFKKGPSASSPSPSSTSAGPGNAPQDPPKPATASQTPAAAHEDAPLIEEIKSSKRKPKLVSPKVAEQGEIIDHFIKVAPTMPRTKPTEPLKDFSEETGNYGDNIVSETLVEILIKQGKKDKAIEMLKKLIWKFPQKKAYFAAQIESLKS